MARVLFTLQYLDDAIYLTRRSLEVQPPDRSAWQQYFTLGEIFKAYGHYQEASLHLRHALDLRPDFEPALAALKEIDSIPEATIHVYTLIIIICLVRFIIPLRYQTVFPGSNNMWRKHFELVFNDLLGRAVKNLGFRSSGHGLKSRHEWKIY